ncbi:VRR-NUC domain-containing protein [Pseudomonas chlororaphis subsp. aureofaciens]|uniref:VRR-NUC domain-containing protein n=1 Tax=Pseudomonas chlororaphis TaxID=587753 RepID=UPI003557DD39
MSGDNPLSTGGMSAPGQTTDVGLTKPRLAPGDKKVLCSAACYCQATPNVAVDGKNLKQQCVAARLNGLDKILMGRSPLKPEVSYDMTKKPPVPIMDSQSGDNPHSWIPGWIKKYWDQDPDHPPFEAGTGMIRRPDVVIVNDPRKSPTQDNIKQVVEMKFPPDSPNTKQTAEYAKIAGGSNKVVTLDARECDCTQEEQTSRVPSEELGWAAAIAAAAAWLLSRGKTPVPRFPVPAGAM